MTTKFCPACKEHLPLTAFRKDKRKKDGLYYRCALCVDTGILVGKPSDEERFLAKTEQQGEHLIWTASKSDQDGRQYGLFRYEGRLQGAHVVSYKLFVGEVTDGDVVHHKCRITLCVNPTCLEKTDHAGNMFYARKEECIHGHLYAEVGKYGGKCAGCHRERNKRERELSE